MAKKDEKPPGTAPLDADSKDERLERAGMIYGDPEGWSYATNRRKQRVRAFDPNDVSTTQ